jgi:hypothetical protein
MHTGRRRWMNKRVAKYMDAAATEAGQEEQQERGGDDDDDELSD